MITTTILFASLFLVPPVTPPVLVAEGSQICAPDPSEPTDIEINHFDEERESYSVVATYTLSTGDVGEAYLSADRSGYGELYFAINGNIVSGVTVTVGEDTESTTSTWSQSPTIYPPELMAELIHRTVVEKMVIGMVPEEFKCSKFGRKVLKAVKYAVYGAATAVTAACCTAVTPACIACAFGAGAAGGAAGDAADGYCE